MNADPSAELYLDLLIRCLTNTIYRDSGVSPITGELLPFDAETRVRGEDLPTEAHTMIGSTRLWNIVALARQVVLDDVPGDFLEAGVARGGAAIMMAGLLRAYRQTARRVWVADSFDGLPRSAKSGVGRGSYSDPYWGRITALSREDPEAFDRIRAAASRGTSLDEVRDTFCRYGLLNERVRFLPGWFRSSLDTPDIGPLAILRVDADLYDSTRDVLTALYPRVVDRGFVIIDDYGRFSECEKAVSDYLTSVRKTITPTWVDADCIFWRKGSEGVSPC